MWRMISATIETTCHTLAIDSEASRGRFSLTDLAFGTAFARQTKFTIIILQRSFFNCLLIFCLFYFKKINNPVKTQLPNLHLLIFPQYELTFPLDQPVINSHTPSELRSNACMLIAWFLDWGQKTKNKLQWGMFSNLHMLDTCKTLKNESTERNRKTSLKRKLQHHYLQDHTHLRNLSLSHYESSPLLSKNLIFPLNNFHPSRWLEFRKYKKQIF